jgi:hypothetical protein
MPFWVKRIVLKSGEIVTERELRSNENFFEGPAPVVGEHLMVECRGRRFEAEVIWGNWPGRNDNEDPSVIVPLRVQETEPAGILQEVSLAGGSQKLVVFDWGSAKSSLLENLVLFDLAGNILWKAQLPSKSGPDCYTQVILDGDNIRAYAWSGYSILLDRETGKILATKFAK